MLRVVLVLGFLGDGVEAGEGEARGRAEALRVGRRGGRLEVGGRAVEPQTQRELFKSRSDWRP